MRDPFKLDGTPTCLSFSGGRTSAYLLWRVLQANGGLPDYAKAIFANTGKEMEETLRFVKACSDEWCVPITWVEYRAGATFEVVDFYTASREGEPFEAVIEQRGGILPNQVSRYCSSEMKTRTIHRHLRSIGWVEWDTFIGIRADEPRRVAKFRANPFPESKDEEVFMPLVEAGISARDVGAFWAANDFDLSLPNIHGKTLHGNCDCCFLKKAGVVRSLIAESPGRAVWWAAQEAKASAVATTPYGARFADDRESYADMARNAAAQHDFIGHDEEAIPCFCGD
jgi:3'-phosphoadenosine 5'-phosphosulfate sulfotransferase (PAPS reductase)/FAD synthetase